MSHMENNENSLIFREYIGVKPHPHSLNNFPDDIIDRDVNQFHFILGFANDTYNAEGKGTGNFNANWNRDFFSPQNVMALKRKHPRGHVKVVISIGGRDASCPFFPAAKEEWWSNAVDSLKEIIQSYNDYYIKDSADAAVADSILIDGIDINYEHIKSNDDDFSYYIGKVIKELKHHVNVVSIAPSQSTRSQYKTLYLDMPDDIDYVHYQFYIQKIPSVNDFLNLFHILAKEYGSNKLLVGASTDQNDEGNFKREDFIESCIKLINTGSLHGIFIWSANDSASNPNSGKPFSLEKKAQEILTKKD